MNEINDLPYTNLSGSMTPPLSPNDIEEDAIDGPDNKRQRLEQHQHSEVELSQHGVCFHCQSRVTESSPWQPSSHGYLATDTLSRVLNAVDPDPSKFEDTVSQLFGFNYVTGTALMDHTKQLFYLMRQKISHYERLAENTSYLQRDGGNEQTQTIRQQCCQFLLYIKIFIHRYYHPSKVPETNNKDCIFVTKINKFPTTLLYHISKLMTHIGSLAVLHQKSLCKELIHLHLDIHWLLLEILHLLNIKVSDGSTQSEVCQLLNSSVRALLWDLVAIGSASHRNVAVQQYHLVTLFPCNCFKELWIQIIHLLDHRNQNMNTESFWCHLYGVIHAVIECCIPEEVTSLGLPPDAMNTSDLKGFCLWILLHISPLYQYDIHGQQSMTKVPIKCNWLAVNDILKSAISPQAGGLDEAKLRCYIKCCISLTSIWEPNTKVIVLIWDQFHKRLNEAFHVPGLGLQDFSSTKKSSASWFEDCFHRCIDSDDNYFSAFNEKGNSFKLFLKLLAVQLIKSKSSNNNQGWKQIKGRFYSKFHQRGMQQLSEVGLEHFIDLFLTLSIVVDTEDVGSRMCDLLDMLPSNRISQRKRIVIWKGLFALILINEDKLLDIKVLAHKLVLQFNAVCREFSQNSDDSNVHYKFWEIISTYLEGIQEVFERSTYLHLSEDQLIGDGFSHLLPVCKDYELHSALSCIQTILLRYRALSMRSSSNNDGPNTAVIKEQHKDQVDTAIDVNKIALTNNGEEANAFLPTVRQWQFEFLHLHSDSIAVALWKHVYPFVKTRSTAMTPPVQLADIAANFTLLAMSMDGDSSVSSPSFLTMIQYFGLQSSQVHTSICCHYLCSILTNQTIVTTLQNSVGTDYHKQVIHAWFRCALLTPNPTEHMQELTTMVIKLSEFTELMQHNEDYLPVGASTKTVLIHFIKAVGKKFTNAMTFQEKVSFRDTANHYFGDIIKVINPVLKSTGPQDVINWIYLVCGNIVKFTAKIIYVQSKPQCLLPNILDHLIVPHVLFNPNKTMPGSQLTAIQDNLHLYLEGMALLECKRDPYLQRRIKDIVCQYFLRFPMRGSASTGSIGASIACSTNHPFLTALQESCTPNASDAARNLRLLMLELLHSNYLVITNNQISPNITTSLVFLKELFRRTTVTEEIARNTFVLFSALLDILLVCDSSAVTAVKKLAVGVLQAMLTAFQQVHDSSSGARVTLQTELQVFISRHFGTSYISVLHVMEAVAVLYRSLVIDVMPKLLDEVYNVERKRGVGTDKARRKAVCKLLHHLGDEGKHFIEIMQEEGDLF